MSEQQKKAEVKINITWVENKKKSLISLQGEIQTIIREAAEEATNKDPVRTSLNAPEIEKIGNIQQRLMRACHKVDLSMEKLLKLKKKKIVDPLCEEVEKIRENPAYAGGKYSAGALQTLFDRAVLFNSSYIERSHSSQSDSSEGKSESKTEAKEAESESEPSSTPGVKEAQDEPVPDNMPEVQEAKSGLHSKIGSPVSGSCPRRNSFMDQLRGRFSLTDSPRRSREGSKSSKKEQKELDELLPLPTILYEQLHEKITALTPEEFTLVQNEEDFCITKLTSEESALILASKLLSILGIPGVVQTKSKVLGKTTHQIKLPMSKVMAVFGLEDNPISISSPHGSRPFPSTPREATYSPLNLGHLLWASSGHVSSQTPNRRVTFSTPRPLLSSARSLWASPGHPSPRTSDSFPTPRASTSSTSSNPTSSSDFFSDGGRSVSPSPRISASPMSTRASISSNSGPDVFFKESAANVIAPSTPVSTTEKGLKTEEQEEGRGKQFSLPTIQATSQS